jgi:phosphatidate cytidylyltransferase
VTNLVKRSFTGIILIAFIIACLFLGEVFFFALCILMIFLGMKEFYDSSTYEHLKIQRWHGIIIGICIYVMFFLYAKEIVDQKIFIPLAPLTLNIFIVELFNKQKKPFINVAYTILGILYIALPISFFNFLVYKGDIIHYSPYVLLAYFGLVWTYDTSAYIWGFLFGTNYLFPRISPHKTWEGLIGGAVTTLIAAWVISKYSRGHVLMDWLIIAAIIVVFGTFGDLSESLFKRSLSLKESGKILPGHGGFLDRFDTVLFSAPIVYAYLELMY